MVKNYYNPNQSHQDDLLQFVKTFIYITDNVFFEFQQEILEIIKSNLGIDILKSESMPGCFSIYTSLPSFVISIAQRRIEISSSAQKNYYIELKIEDGNCIIFSNVYEFNVTMNISDVFKEKEFSTLKIMSCADIKQMKQVDLASPFNKSNCDLFYQKYP